MRHSRKARDAKRKIGVLGVIACAGALVSGFGSLEVLPDVGYAVEASSLARQAPSQMQRNPHAARGRTPVLIAAGDIADCGSRGDSATAALVREIPGIVATLGDHVYDSGSKREFAECYDPTWGTERKRTRPAAGNHDYETRNAAGYFDYFGNAAGARGKGYYSYDLGAWHIIVLNSNCDDVGGCGADTPQWRWLHKDLASHDAACTLAYWHHPLFSSGKHHGGDNAMRPAWEALYDAGADVVLSAHEHNYERFAPQDPSGRLDRQRGIRQFVVGAGGASHYGFGRPLKTSEARESETFGVLVLTLRGAGYDWEFVPVTSRLEPKHGEPFADAGSADCH